MMQAQTMVTKMVARVNFTGVCPTCGADYRVAKKREFKVFVPALKKTAAVHCCEQCLTKYQEVMKMQKQTQSQNQIQNTRKGNVKTMNKAIALQLINSKEVLDKNTGKKVVFPVQVQMTLTNGIKSQTVKFGYSRLGGRQTYLVVEGKAPVNMSRADFMQALHQWGVANLGQVQSYISRLKFFHRDQFIVAKCECCGGYVTAANIDFIQRNYKKLSAKLGRQITEHSRLCYKCQNGGGPKPPKGGQPTPKQPSSAAKQSPVIPVVNVEKIKDIVDRALVNLPTKNELEQREAAVTENKGAHFELSPQLVEEILALEVDPFSELAKFQRQLEERYYAYRKQVNTAWALLHQEHKEKAETRASEASAQEGVLWGASEASSPLIILEYDVNDICDVCDRKLPPVEEWDCDVCPHCVYEDREERMMGNAIAPEFYERAAEYVNISQQDEAEVRASEASAQQEEAPSSSVAERGETKEGPHAEQEEVAVCSDAPGAGSCLASASNDVAEFMSMINQGLSDADVPPMIRGGVIPF